ncbi:MULTISPECIES: teichoic acid D-Ala incorporation-associated protein DltX [unclassified Enterococcus]|nr:MULTISPECIES: teichoic acid D-Ala incorporation-associated protein DltX [unclassified Enterococcus]
MKKWYSNPQFNYWGTFIIRTIFYSAVLLMLIYLYHYKNIQGGSFIYNEF